MDPSIEKTGLEKVQTERLVKELSMRSKGCAVVLVVEDRDGDDCVVSYGFGSKILLRGAIETMRDDLLGFRLGLNGHKGADDDEEEPANEPD